MKDVRGTALGGTVVVGWIHATPRSILTRSAYTLQLCPQDTVGCPRTTNGNGLDCQWLDITDLAPGDYQIEVVVNPNHAFEEVSQTNNTIRVPVTIPSALFDLPSPRGPELPRKNDCSAAARLR